MKAKHRLAWLLTIVHATRLGSFPVITVCRANQIFCRGRFLNSEPSDLYDQDMTDWQKIDPAYFGHDVVQGRRIAKDETYRRSIQDIWENEGVRQYPIETRSIHYSAVGDSSTLYGHILRRQCQPTTDSPRPAILLFHTAAGPQDIFLFYKADVLLQSLDCIVMICDILSDENGWGWDPDRTRYNEARQALMADGAALLKKRVSAAVHCLTDGFPRVDSRAIVAMGWCLGGQPVLELASLHEQMTNFTVQAMITFHGVFARDSKLRPSTTPTDSSFGRTTVLICNGKEDPFVSSADLEETKAYFESYGFVVETLQIDKAKHGFTNPAQNFNENPAFAYSQEGAVLAWAKTMELLKAKLSFL